MSEYQLSGRADQDLREISGFLAIAGPQVARRWLMTLEQHFMMLAENKHFGRARPDLGQDIRYSVVKGYLIFYRPTRGGILVLRVVHSKRNIQALEFDE